MADNSENSAWNARYDGNRVPGNNHIGSSKAPFALFNQGDSWSEGSFNRAVKATYEINGGDASNNSNLNDGIATMKTLGSYIKIEMMYGVNATSRMSTPEDTMHGRCYPTPVVYTDDYHYIDNFTSYGVTPTGSPIAPDPIDVTIPGDKTTSSVDAGSYPPDPNNSDLRWDETAPIKSWFKLRPRLKFNLDFYTVLEFNYNIDVANPTKGYLCIPAGKKLPTHYAIGSEPSSPKPDESSDWLPLGDDGYFYTYKEIYQTAATADGSVNGSGYTVPANYLDPFKGMPISSGTTNAPLYLDPASYLLQVTNEQATKYIGRVSVKDSSISAENQTGPSLDAGDSVGQRSQVLAAAPPSTAVGPNGSVGVPGYPYDGIATSDGIYKDGFLIRVQPKYDNTNTNSAIKTISGGKIRLRVYKSGDNLEQVRYVPFNLTYAPHYILGLDPGDYVLRSEVVKEDDYAQNRFLTSLSDANGGARCVMMNVGPANGGSVLQQIQLNNSAPSLLDGTQEYPYWMNTGTQVMTASRSGGSESNSDMLNVSWPVANQNQNYDGDITYKLQIYAVSIETDPALRTEQKVFENEYTYPSDRTLAVTNLGVVQMQDNKDYRCIVQCYNNLGNRDLDFNTELEILFSNLYPFNGSVQGSQTTVCALPTDQKVNNTYYSSARIQGNTNPPEGAIIYTNVNRTPMVGSGTPISVIALPTGKGIQLFNVDNYPTAIYKQGEVVGVVDNCSNN